MKKSRKITLIVLACVSAAFLAGYLVLFFLMPVFAQQNYAEMLAAMFLSMSDMFALPFMGAEGLPLALSIVTLVLSGIWLVTFVIPLTCYATPGVFFLL